MSKLPRDLSGAKAVKAFGRAGFTQVRQDGSHIILKKAGFEYLLCVPNHKTLKPGTLRSLIDTAEMTVEEFCDLL